MQTQRYRGFVIKTVPLSASRHIMVAFTQNGGKRQGIFRVSKQHPQAYLSPFTLLEFQLKGRQTQQLPSIIAPQLERHYFNIAGDYCSLSLLHHWANLVDASQAESQEDHGVFRLIDHCLTHLSLEKSGLFPLQNLYFEVWLLHFAGVLPKPRSQNTTTGTSPTEQAFKKSDLERTYQALDPRLLMRIFQQNIEDFASVSLQCEALTRAMVLLEHMWHHYLGRPVKTHAHLQNRFKERGLL